MKKVNCVMYLMFSGLIVCVNPLHASETDNTVEMRPFIEVNSGKEAWQKEKKEDEKRKEEVRVASSCCTWQGLGKPCCKAFATSAVLFTGIWFAVYGYTKLTAHSNGASNTNNTLPMNATDIHHPLHLHRLLQPLSSRALPHNFHAETRRPTHQKQKKQIYQPMPRKK